MRLETFFEKFDLFADCPNAVQKMRELILELAVQGKLVEQDQGWAVDDNKPFSIPSNWEWSSLSLLGEMSGGMTPSKSDSSYWDGGVPWFSSKDIKSEELLSSELTISEKGLKETRLRLYPPGCIFIVARSGILKRTLPVSINRVAASVNQDLKVFQPARDIEIRYIQVALKGLERSILTEYVKTGTTVQSLKYDEFEAMPIPLPPLAEQKRIVAKVDELMALCDALEAQQKERETKRAQLAKASLAAFADAPSQTSLELLFHPSFSIDPADLRKSILTLAVQGKLVPQDPGDENFDALVSRISGERKSLNRPANKTAEVDSSGLEFDIPTHWGWMTLEGLLLNGPTNGYSPKAVDYETPVKSLTLSATTSGKFKGEYSKCIADIIPDDSDLWLRDGDILVQRGNTIEYVGVAAVYWGEPNKFIYPDLMMRLRVATCLDVGFIHLAMSAQYAREYLRNRASGTSGTMPKINQATLRSLPIPLPPLVEQKRIVAKVDELMALVERLEAKIVASREAASRLLEAMVAELSGKAAA